MNIYLNLRKCLFNKYDINKKVIKINVKERFIALFICSNLCYNILVMRVIAGEKRHLLLKTVDDLSIRPTTDRIKETLFNILQFDLAGINFLDLFAGSGAIGIEALSRGAKFATFVDNNDKAIKVIKENLEHTGLLERANVIRGDAALALENLSRNKVTYDIVFMDPPYDKGLYVPVMERLSKSNLINENSKIIIETGIKDRVEEVEKFGYEIYRVKEYKGKKHTFLKKK